MILSDIELARRLERAEAVANARFVEARAVVAPQSGACWTEAGGTYAMYDGAASPCTQTFGLGLFGTPDHADWDRLEHFFQERHAPVFHEVSPLSGNLLLGSLSGRGYRAVELTNVMYLPLESHHKQAADGAVRVRRVGVDEADLWARTAAEGWREHAEFGDAIPELMRVSARRAGTMMFLAEMEGRPVAAGAAAVHEGVALLAGASTVPEWRNRGAQRALHAARLVHAAEAGCDLAMVCAEPGSQSQRNAERQGFRIAYTRIKWQLA